MNDQLVRWLDEVEFWFFDLDGTLVASTPYRQVLRLISRLVGVPYSQLLRRYRQEWRGLDEAREYHYSLACNEGVRDHIKVAYGNYAADNHTPTVIPGSFECLEALREMKKFLVCYTRGIKSWQEIKLQVTGLTPFFDDICIVKKKDVEQMRTQALRVCNGSDFIMIGNTFTDDIAPAKGIAKGRIYVTHDPHDLNTDRPHSLSDDILVIDTLADINPTISEKKGGLHD